MPRKQNNKVMALLGRLAGASRVGKARDMTIRDLNYYSGA
jgi:hypothetical protein